MGAERRLRILATILMSSVASLGCAAVVPTGLATRFVSAEPLQPRLLAPVQQLSPEASTRARLGGFNSDSDHYLYLLTEAVGLDYRTSRSFLQTLHKHPKARKKDNVVGHSWIILEGPTRLLEVGHTGEFGIEKPTYYRGVAQRIWARDPNPIAYLWEEMPDGEFHRGSNGHVPTFVLRTSITKEEHDAIYHLIDTYDYDRFAVRDHQCTDLVRNAAALIGIYLTHRVELTVPAQIRFRGRDIQLWQDPLYQKLVIGSPDALESALRELYASGVGVDAIRWYLED